ncbi:MAG: hypothetical protein ICV84_13255 [Flavisolibacter sp.]|nr:hypothetical protein [Flavisolibacter sp.]
MEDKKVDFGMTVASLIRIECLLEELIFRQILANENNNIDAANERFKSALQNIDDAVAKRFEELPSVDEPSFDED